MTVGGAPAAQTPSPGASGTAISPSVTGRTSSSSENSASVPSPHAALGRSAAALPGARLLVVPGAGHGLPREAPQAVAAAIATTA